VFLITDTENAIRHLDNNIRHTYRYLATKKVIQIIITNTHNTLHKKLQYNLNQIKIILQRNNLTTAKADKGKTMVVTDKNTLEQKTDTRKSYNTFEQRPYSFLSETNSTSNSKM